MFPFAQNHQYANQYQDQDHAIPPETSNAGCTFQPWKATRNVEIEANGNPTGISGS